MSSLRPQSVAYEGKVQYGRKALTDCYFDRGRRNDLTPQGVVEFQHERMSSLKKRSTRGFRIVARIQRCRRTVGLATSPGEFD